MAIALDGTAQSASTPSNATTSTWSHVVTSNANGVLLVGVGWPSATITATVKYNAVSMTAVTAPIVSGVYSYQTFYLLLPSTGTNNVIVTFSSAVRCGAASLSLTGVNQAAPDANNSNTGVGTAVSTSITTVANNDWLFDGFITAATTGVATATSPQTAIGSKIQSATGVFDQQGSYKGPVSTGSNSMGWTLPTGAWIQQVVAVAPTAGTAYTSSLSGTYSTSGGLTRAMTRNLTATYSASGALARTTSRLFTGAYTTAGSLLRGTGVGLSGLYSTSGTITRRISKSLTGLYKTTGSITSHAITRALTASYIASGSLAKRLGRALTGTYSTSGSLSTNHARQWVQALSATYQASGTLAKKTTKLFIATYRTSGLLRTFIPPVWNYITATLSGLIQRFTGNDNASATLGTTATIDKIQDSANTANQAGELNTQTINSEKQNKDIGG